MTPRQRLLFLVVLAPALGCGGSDVTLPPLSPMNIPGEDQIVEPNTLVHLDGSASTDPLNRPLSFHWSIAQKPPGSNSVLDSPLTAMTTITPDLEGTYNILLVVSAGTEQSGAQISIFAVAPDGGVTPPDAGP